MADNRSLGEIMDTVIGIADNNGSFRDMVIAAGMDPATSFVGANLQDADFRDENLQGFNFTNANLKGCDFRRASFDGVSFKGALIYAAIGLPSQIQHSVLYYLLAKAFVAGDRVTVQTIIQPMIGYDMQKLAEVTDQIIQDQAIPLEYAFHEYLWTVPEGASHE